MVRKVYLIQDSFNKPVIVCENKHCIDRVVRFFEKKNPDMKYKFTELPSVWNAEDVTNARESLDECQEKIDLIKKVIQ